MHASDALAFCWPHGRRSIPGVIRLGIKYLRDGSHGALPSDTDGRFVLFREDLFQDMCLSFVQSRSYSKVPLPIAQYRAGAALLKKPYGLMPPTCLAYTNASGQP